MSDDLTEALRAAGADESAACDSAHKIAEEADVYARDFGMTDLDCVAIPMHKGWSEWGKHFASLTERIESANKRHRWPLIESEIDPPTLGLVWLVARLDKRDPTIWQEFRRSLDAINEELGCENEKPRRGVDRATRRMFVTTANIWRKATGKWPTLTKKIDDNTDLSNTYIVSPLLDFIRARIAGANTAASKSLTDAKFEKALRIAKKARESNV